MSQEFTLVPMLSVHPTRLNLYSEIVWHDHDVKRNPFVHLQNVSKDHGGKISTTARRKIGKAIDYLLFMSNDKALPCTLHGKAYSFKLAFVTLTLPSTQRHSDGIIKTQCLNQFLVEARKYWNVRNYIWRAEKQKNGNIHFHILVDRFIPWSELRDRWNRITNKLDYVDNYRNEMRAFHAGGFKVRKALIARWAYKAQVKAYKVGKANDWASPNSTDIHAIHKAKNIKAYIQKYCTKDEQNEGLEGRLWGCNYSLSAIPGAKMIIDTEIEAALTHLFDEYAPKCYEGDYFSTYTINFSMLTDPLSKVLFERLSVFFLDHFNYNLQTRLRFT